MHLTRQGTDWNVFLVGHPGVAQRLGLASVAWNGARFYTRIALSRWLVAHNSTLAKWEIAHPGFAEKLVRSSRVAARRAISPHGLSHTENELGIAEFVPSIAVVERGW